MKKKNFPSILTNCMNSEIGQYGIYCIIHSFIVRARVNPKLCVGHMFINIYKTILKGTADNIKGI